MYRLPAPSRRPDGLVPAHVRPDSRRCRSGRIKLGLYPSLPGPIRGGNGCASLLVFSRLRAKGWTGRRNAHCRIRPCWSASRSSEIMLTSTADLTGPFWRHLLRGAHPAKLCLYRSSLPRGRDPLNPPETSGCADSPVECDTGPALLPYCPRARPSPTRPPWPRCIPTKAPSRALTCPVRARSGSWSSITSASGRVRTPVPNTDELPVPSILAVYGHSWRRLAPLISVRQISNTTKGASPFVVRSFVRADQFENMADYYWAAWVRFRV